MLSKSEISFILLLFFNCITQVSSFHKIIQISLCISHLHRGSHSGKRSLYLCPSSWWFHFYKSQVLSLWRIISYFDLLLHSVIPSYTSYHLQKTSIPLPSYQIRTLGPSHQFPSYSLKVSFCYLPSSLLLLFPFHHLSYSFNEWTMLSKSKIIFILLLFFNCITQVSSFHKIIQISLCISHLHRGRHSGSQSLYLYPSY